MSNVKEVNILAVLPFGYEQEDANKELVYMLAKIMLNPVFGLKVILSEKGGGPTTQTRIIMVISGTEAIGWGYIDALLYLLSATTKDNDVIEAHVRDVETDEVATYTVSNRVINKQVGDKLYKKYRVSAKEISMSEGIDVEREFRGGKVIEIAGVGRGMYIITTVERVKCQNTEQP